MDNTGELVTEFLADYQAYVDTIRLLSTLDVAMLCQGHRIIFTGEDVPRFFKMSLDSALAFREMVEKVLNEESGDIGKTVAWIKGREYDPKPHPKQPERAYLINLEARGTSPGPKISYQGLMIFRPSRNSPRIFSMWRRAAISRSRSDGLI